jgi:hypothetical protein
LSVRIYVFRSVYTYSTAAARGRQDLFGDAVQPLLLDDLAITLK